MSSDKKDTRLHQASSKHGKLLGTLFATFAVLYASGAPAWMKLITTFPLGRYDILAFSPPPPP
jgi:hypothetical protein